MPIMMMMMKVMVTMMMMMMHALRSFSEDPIITGPLVCHWCEDATFVYDADFAAHKQKVHSGENEYRKRVLLLMEQSGSRPITGQEKRIIVQKFAHLQQFSRPGANRKNLRAHSRRASVRSCMCCASGSFIEHRLAGCSPRARPQTCVRYRTTRSPQGFTAKVTPEPRTRNKRQCP